MSASVISRSFTDGVGFEKRSEEGTVYKDRERVELALEDGSALEWEKAEESELALESAVRPGSEISDVGMGTPQEVAKASVEEEKITASHPEESTSAAASAVATTAPSAADSSAAALPLVAGLEGEAMSIDPPQLSVAPAGVPAAIASVPAASSSASLLASSASSSIYSSSSSSSSSSTSSSSSAVDEAASAMASLSSLWVNAASDDVPVDKRDVPEVPNDANFPPRPPIEAGPWLGHISNGQWQIREHYILPALKYVLKGLEESGHIDRVEVEGSGGRNKTCWIAANR